MSSTVVSEAEGILAKYSAMKPLLSRPSQSTMPRFPSMAYRSGLIDLHDDDDAAADREPRVTPLRVPTQSSRTAAASSAHTEAATPQSISATPSFRIINRSSSIAQLHPTRSPGHFPIVDNDVPIVSPSRGANVISPRRSVRIAGPVGSSALVQTPSSHNLQGHQTPVRTAQDTYGGGGGGGGGGFQPADQSTALDEIRGAYSSHVEFFGEVAKEERQETLKLQRDNTRLREELVQSEMIKDEIHVESENKVMMTREECTRQLLSLRKSLLLSEQTSGSLRTENEALYQRATDADILREELDMQRVKYEDLQQKMTILAQQNSALQRVLKQKEQDCSGDLDIYVKQLDVVQKQNAAMKKEMEIMTINTKNQQALEKEIERLHRKNEEVQLSVQALDKEAAAQQQRHDLALQEKDDDCAREILNYRRQIVTLEKQAESLQTQLEAHLRRQRPSALQDQIAALAKKVETLSAVLVEQERGKEEITAVAQELQHHLEMEKRAAREAQDLYRRAMEELKAERSSHRQARRELEELTANLSRAVADAHQQIPR
ncbi:Hypothetical protein, putative [Bodo saltans]|uniref:Uncharacterized protein n=1 Tax=Bodo saltans TaxID=75058 RepID=A0A0S4JFU4_BODSA|nr:Hypothetical protein, putative [Bodo saltans]|eukprot:CUG90318.1 Hypothetical protein, putative [Bodo saltans]